jgi:excisionase family DNA binding protein
VSTSQNSASPVRWLTYGEAANQLGIDVPGIKQLVRDGGLLAVPVDGQRRVPAPLIEHGEISKYLRGVINLLRDGGYDDDEAVAWLLRYDDSLGGTPAWALHHQLHREVSRRAQALAF